MPKEANNEDFQPCKYSKIICTDLLESSTTWETQLQSLTILEYPIVRLATAVFIADESDSGGDFCIPVETSN